MVVQPCPREEELTGYAWGTVSDAQFDPAFTANFTFVTPFSGSVEPFLPNSGVLVRPSTIRPAAR